MRTPLYGSDEALADRVQQAVAQHPEREVDAFLSYARIDGRQVGGELREELERLQRARAGIAVLTPAYLAGRFWTERELGALLHKDTLIPVLHGVTFDEVKEYSGILPDLAGFETSRDPVVIIAGKIAAAVLGPVQATSATRQLLRAIRRSWANELARAAAEWQ